MPGAVLHAARPGGHEGVEGVAVEVAGDRFVVPDAAQPRTRRQRSIGRAELVGERPVPGDRRRPARDRRRRRGESEQVEVVVVQPGEQGPAAGVDQVSGAGRAGGNDRGDALAAGLASRTSTPDGQSTSRVAEMHQCPIPHS